MPNVRPHPRLKEGGAAQLNRLQVAAASYQLELLRHLSAALKAAHTLSRTFQDRTLDAAVGELADCIVRIAENNPDNWPQMQPHLLVTERLLMAISTRIQALRDMPSPNAPTSN